MSGARISLGDFDLDRPVGQGGMAEVWLGHHRTLGQQAAIKVIRGKMARDNSFVQGFHREVRAVAGLDHPGIVGVYDTGLVDAEAADASGGTLTAGSPWLAMAYAGGGDLTRWPTPMSWGRLHGLLLEVLDALAHAHARGVIHRDLKPANVLVRAEGGRRLMLTDFGIAHIVEPNSDSGGIGTTSSGTPHYMSPEQIRGHWRDYGPWTDLYAIGCMAYEFATGRLPFDGRSPVTIAIQHVSAPVPGLGETRGVPAVFEQWVQRMLAKDPRDRFECAADAAWQLARMPAPRSMSGIRPSGPLAAEGDRPTASTRAVNTLAILIDTAMLDGLASSTLVRTTPATVVDVTRTTDAAFSVPRADRDPTQSRRRSDAGLPPMPPSWRLPGGAEQTRRALGTGLFAVRQTPFVGRIDARDALWRALRTVRRTQQTRMVLVEGPAGSGKSRLADWLGCRAEEVGAGIALRASHGPVPSPLDGVVSAMRSWFRGFGLGRLDLRARIEERLQRLLPSFDTEGLAEAAEGLAALLDPDPRAPGKPRNPAELRATTAYWLRLATGRRPLVLCLDDAQFGPDSLALAEHLLAGRKQTPILIVATIAPAVIAERRIEARLRDRLAERSDVETLTLGPLPAAEHTALVATLLQLDPALVTAVCRGTGGDPWFAEQVVADWIDRGVLELGPTGYRAERADVPPDVPSLVARRLDAFAERRRRTSATWDALMVAAALGTTVDRSEWIAVCASRGSPPPADLESALDARGWIRQVGGGWTFSHSAWRAGIVRRARQTGLWAELNRACAQALRAASPSDVGWARIARHHAEAGELRTAATAGIEAAAAILEAGDYHRVLDMVARVTEQADAAGLEADHAVRGRALWLEADVYRYLARFDASDAVLDRLEAFPQPEAQAEMRRIRAGVVHMRGRLPQAAALYAAAAARYASIGNVLGEVRSHHGAAWVELTAGRYADAGRIFEQAAEKAQAHGFELDEAWCRHGMASSLIFQGLPGAGVPARRALQCFMRYGARAGVAATRMFVGEALGFEGRYDDARSWFESAIELWQALESNFTGLGWTGLGLMCLDAGWNDEAAAAFDMAQGVPPAFAMLQRVGFGLVRARAGDLAAWQAITEGGQGAVLKPPRLRHALTELAERVEAGGLIASASTTWRWAATAWRSLDPHKADACLARAHALAGA